MRGIGDEVDEVGWIVDEVHERKWKLKDFSEFLKAHESTSRGSKGVETRNSETRKVNRAEAKLPTGMLFEIPRFRKPRKEWSESPLLAAETRIRCHENVLSMGRKSDKQVRKIR